MSLSPLSHNALRVLTGLISASVITIAAGHAIGLGAAALSFLLAKAQTFIRETETPLEQPSFNIKFGRVARTLVYEDTLAWIIHEVSSQKRKDALKGMMNTGFRHPAFPFGASIA
jgi:hypothetical protein